MSWNFETPPEEMTLEQLNAELRAISELSTPYDFDEVAVDRILDAMNAIDPMPGLSDEDTKRSLAAFRTMHPEFFRKSE